MEQLTHEQVNKHIKNFPIVIVGDEIRTPQNVGMSLRVADAFGIEKFYLNPNSPDLDNRAVQRTARNTDKTLTTEYYKDSIVLIEKLKAENYTIIALEITDNSKLLHDYNFTQHQKIALIVGSERFGINPEVLSLCEHSLSITMFGENSSMNVVNSLSVCLYEITKQLNHIL